ncbi:MAG: Methylase of chemotaxis methyl-accepting protein, CheR-type [bacterium]|nr:Methylase of chemotaxis methyl-accepting protein, CheR-type [bacterium]
MASERTKDRFVEEVLERIQTARHFDFRDYKRATLKRRIERRMSERKCRAPSDYLSLLTRDAAEIDTLVSSLLIKVTSFFRDREAWEALSTRVIPQMLANKRAGQEMRVWCAGCATGEEAYSVAMLLADAIGPSFPSEDVKIFGTDLDEAAVAHARRGHYSAQQVEGVPPAMLKHWFTADGGGYAVNKEIRRKVVFGVNDLVSDAPISRLDLLLCRNVFIYLEANLQKLVLTRFHYGLRRNGVLMLGKSELIPFAAKIFEPIDLSRRMYRKDHRREGTLAQERLVGLAEQESQHRAAEDRSFSYVDEFHHDVLQSLRVPIIAIAIDGTVTAWNRASAALWSRDEAAVIGKKLNALNLPGLSGDLLIEKTGAVRDGKLDRERSEAVLGETPGGTPRSIAVNVWPVRDAKEAIVGISYVIEDVTGFRDLELELRRVNEERQSAFEELQTTNEELQSSNEELETTNEELQSANEELQTTNEELQSINEELETTNEELQSTNSELDATNRELAHRTEEMNRFWVAHRTIIRSLSAAIVVVDADGRVGNWNLAAERLLGIAESEAVGQTLWTLNIPALGRVTLQRVRKTLAENRVLRVETVEYELPTGTAGHATLAAVPILDDQVNRGAVIIFEDITRQVLLQKQLAAAKGENDSKPAKSNGKRR